jgi:hypothetical protein
VHAPCLQPMSQVQTQHSSSAQQPAQRQHQHKSPNKAGVNKQSWLGTDSQLSAKVQPHAALPLRLLIHCNCTCPLPSEIHPAVWHDPVEQFLPVLTPARPVKCSIAARQAEGAQCGELGVGRYHGAQGRQVVRLPCQVPAQHTHGAQTCHY